MHVITGGDQADQEREGDVLRKDDRYRRPRRRPGRGSSTALVGSYETVAAAILDHVDLGFEIFGLRGDDFLTDAEEFGRHVIPLVRSEVAHRDGPSSSTGRSRREELRRAAHPAPVT